MRSLEGRVGERAMGVRDIDAQMSLIGELCYSRVNLCDESLVGFGMRFVTWGQ